ncbi:MAG: MEDS domain-containing protein [Phycisphaerae bacterium]|nr:MEDS domain-containing protein [Phycisphaerae bacterium]
MTSAKHSEQGVRKTGIPALGDIPWGSHVCQFYHTKEDLIDILVPYFKAGLESHELCMWITSEPLCAQEAKEALAKSVSGLEEHIKSGQIEIIPAGEWYLKEGAFDPRRVLKGWVNKHNKALDNGYKGIRVTGNTLWLEKRLWKDFMDYEKEINEIIHQYRIIVLCSYSLGDCEISEVIQVSNNHQFTLIKNEGKWELLKDGERKLAERKLLAYQGRLKSLASELALVDEKGKHHIAVQLREKAAQTLIASRVKLEMLSKSISSEEFRKIVDEVCQLLSATTRDLCSLSLEINSPILYELGFEKGVACLVEEQMDSKSAIKSKFEDDGQVKPLSNDVKILLFRSVRELLSNVIEHAHAQNVKVSIRKLGSQIKVRIEDDGVGFSPSETAQRKEGSGHFSIGVRLRELGGYLEIDSKPEQGCRVTMTAPLTSDS